MNLKKDAIVIGIFMAVFMVTSYLSSLLASYGISDSMFPAIPIIGALPIVGALIAWGMWKFYLKKYL